MDKRIYIQATIGDFSGRQPIISNMRFLLDTGAENTILRESELKDFSSSIKIIRMLEQTEDPELISALKTLMKTSNLYTLTPEEQVLISSLSGILVGFNGKVSLADRVTLPSLLIDKCSDRYDRTKIHFKNLEVYVSKDVRVNILGTDILQYLDINLLDFSTQAYSLTLKSDTSKLDRKLNIGEVNQVNHCITLNSNIVNEF